MSTETRTQDQDQDEFDVFPRVYRLKRNDGSVVVEIVYKDRIETFTQKSTYTRKDHEDEGQDWNAYIYNEEYWTDNGYRKVAASRRTVVIKRDPVADLRARTGTDEYAPQTDDAAAAEYEAMGDCQ